MSATDWDRVRKRFGEAAFTHLRDAKVAVLGLGSGGSRVALDLACNGVGNLVLVDPDVVSESNVVRHACDLRDVGRAKVEAVADLIRYRNETANVVSLATRAEEVFEEHIADADVVAVCVDSAKVKQLINQAALSAGVTAVYAGVFERGIGGIVSLVRPNQGPCYACIASRTQPAQEESQNVDAGDYGVYDDEGTLHGEPGLGIHVARIAGIQADWITRLLFEDVAGSEIAQFPAGKNVLRFQNEAGDIIIPGKVFTPLIGLWLNYTKLEGCLVCSADEESVPELTALLD